MRSLIFSLFVSLTAGAYTPPPEMVASPALLVNYIAWVREMDAIGESPAAKALRSLTEILYDRQIGRPWGEAYFPEAQKRLEAFRQALCGDAATVTVCSPAALKDDMDVLALMKIMKEPATLEFLQGKTGLKIEAVAFPGSEFNKFNMLANRDQDVTTSQHAYWNHQGAVTRTVKATAYLSDVDTYLQGFQQKTPSQYVAFGRSGVVMNDWRIRHSAMKLARHWKSMIERAAPDTDKISFADVKETLMRRLLDEKKSEFDATLARLEALVQTHEPTKQRFAKEKSEGHYPEEVYQHMAYALVREVLDHQSAALSLIGKAQPLMSLRQQLLASTLTVQRYGATWRFFLYEILGRSEIFTDYAAALDQLVPIDLAMTYLAEHFNAVLEQDVYAGQGLFAKYGYALLEPELFDADYLKEYQSEIFQRLQDGQGGLKDVRALPPAEQIEILKTYLRPPEGQRLNISGFYRMSSAFGYHIKEKDLRELSEVIYKARYQSRKKDLL